LNNGNILKMMLPSVAGFGKFNLKIAQPRLELKKFLLSNKNSKMLVYTVSKIVLS